MSRKDICFLSVNALTLALCCITLSMLLHPVSQSKILLDNMELHNRYLKEILESDVQLISKLRISVDQYTNKVQRDLSDYAGLVQRLDKEVALIPEVAAQRSMEIYLRDIERKIRDLSLQLPHED